MLIADNKFVFVHLQKTGGSFIKAVLPKIEIDCHIMGGHPTLHTYYHSKNNLSQHSPNEYKEFCNNHLIFGVIRNPWDLYVSLWKFLTHHIGNSNRILPDFFPNIINTDALKEMDINNFVTHLFENETHTSDIYLSNFENLKELNIGQYTYEFLRLFTHRKEYSIIELAGKIPNKIYLDDINNLCVNRFLRFENLSIELADLMKEIYDISKKQYDCIVSHKKMNVSDYSEDEKKFSNMKIKSDAKLKTDDQKKYRKYYNDDTIKLIYEKDGLLIDKFNYSY